MSLFAVNGKDPVAVWCPSLDDAGNGTTTLTDLVGSNDGTLTNMDAATDWVADTDSGGVRALDFDGVNDYVDMGVPVVTSTSWTASAWVKPAANKRHFILDQYEHSVPAKGLAIESGLTAWKPRGLSAGSSNFDATGPDSLTLNTWTHIGFSTDGSRADLYVNGVLVASDVVGSALASTVAFNVGRLRAFNSFFWNGRLDDMRIWDQAIESADFAALATSRGYTESTGNPQRRKQSGIPG